MDIKDITPWNWGRKHPPVKAEQEDPFHALQRGVGGLFEDFFRRLPGIWDEFSLGAPGAFSPRINVTEDDKAIKVTAELPGMDEKDLDVTLTKDTLTLKGEKKQEHEDQGKDYYRLERSYGSFRRAIPLPCEVVTDQVEARFKKGVLTITLPKSPEVKKGTRRIAVKAE